MRLIDALPVKASTRMAFVGAGGKSGAMFRLARQALADGTSLVLVSASTHLSIGQIPWADRHFIVEHIEDLGRIDFETLSGLVLITGPKNHEYRTDSLSPKALGMLAQVAGSLGAPLLIEGDGSRRRPLKAPAAHEPAIPPWITEVVVVVGMTGIEQSLSEETTHRPELFSQLSGIPLGELVTVQGLGRMLTAEQGGLKDIPPGAKRTALLNQADTPDLAGQAARLARKLEGSYQQTIIARMRNEDDEVIAVHRQTAGVVLAGGGGVRMGRPKQLLDWKGQPFVRAVTETALAAGLDPVLVVTGAYQEDVTIALAGLPVEVIHNPDWAQGQSASVRVAVRELSQPAFEGVSAAVFLLVDQPQIEAVMVRALVDAYSKSLSPVVAPLVDGRRGNPVLFDRRTFDLLAGVEGDAGGRQVFSKFPLLYLPWLDQRAALDVDTEEDYRRLLDEG